MNLYLLFLINEPLKRQRRKTYKRISSNNRMSACTEGEGRLHTLYLNILYINYGTNKKRARYIQIWFTYAVVHLHATGRWSWSISWTLRQVRSIFRNFKFSKQIVKIKWIFLRNSWKFKFFHQRKFILIKNIWNV